MPIYRSDQSQLTFATEAAPGGYPELATSVTNGDGDDSLSGAHEAGSSSVTVASSSGITAGEYIKIGTGASAQLETEIRKVEFVDGNVLHLSAPTAFYHPNAATVQVITAVADTAADVIINQIPGIYETIDLPDPTMDIQPAYFLGTTSKRNYNRAYAGQQTYSGSAPNMVLINGRPLRYPIGKVVSDVSSVAARTYLSVSAYKGDMYITVASPTNLAANDIICIDVPTAVSSGTVSSTSVGEIRKIAAISSSVITLDYPLQFDHTSAGSGTTQITEAGATVYTHQILETSDLDTMTWHAHMRSSDESQGVAYDFDRRYFGGKVGSATISAEEGGVLMMSWDSVDFLGMIHSQKGSGMDVPFYSLMQPIRSGEVVQPSTEPYYFSEGIVTMFGTTIARMRSFSLNINNNLESRYYITRRGASQRKGPSEIRENRREYSMSATLAIPDVRDQTNSTTASIFNQLLQEGIRSNGGTTQGFEIILTFARGNGNDDYISIKIPDDGVANQGADAQGAIIRSAPHNITTDGPLQVDVDILFRNMQIYMSDSEHYYP